MKLCFVIHSLNAGGAERVLSQLANYYAKKNTHDVHIMTLQSEGTEPFYDLHPDISLHQLGLNQRGSACGKIKRVGLRLRAMRQALKILKPSKIISFIDEMNIAILLSTLFLNKNIIISERVDPQYYKISLPAQVLRRLLYPFAKCLVVQGEYIASYFSYMKDKVTIIPNAILMSKTLSHSEREEKKIITVGRLNIQKDQATLIKAFAQIAYQYPEWSLDIYGEGPEKTNLQSLIVDLSMMEKVFLKSVYTPIQEKLNQASLFVFPSLFEGFPNALGEAMSVGLPVIVSDCKGNLELVQDGQTGVVFPVKNILSLRKKLEVLMQAPHERDRLGDCAKLSIDRFSLEKIHLQWDKLIEESP